MSFITNLRFSSSSDVDEQAYINPTLTQRLQNYAEPAILFSLVVLNFFKILFSTIAFNPSSLFPFSRVRSKAFAKAWLLLGSSNGSVGPLKNIVPFFNSVTGVVLDVGPGDGRQLINYTNPGIKSLYGAEPCADLHAELQVTAEKFGLGQKLHILDCGAEREGLVPKLLEVGLLKQGGVEGVFDTIVCSKVLCSVPDQKDTVAGLYALLKPGGRLIVCEHVKNPWRTPKGSLIARAIQEFFMLQGWSWFMGGCRLTLNTDEIVKAIADGDGGWEKVDLEYVVQWGTIPYVLGELTKKG